MSSHRLDSARVLPAPPDIIAGNIVVGSGGFSPPHSSFSFMPIGPAPSSSFLPPTVKPSPVVTNKGVSSDNYKMNTSLPRYQGPTPLGRMRLPNHYITGMSDTSSKSSPTNTSPRFPNTSTNLPRKSSPSPPTTAGFSRSISNGPGVHPSGGYLPNLSPTIPASAGGNHSTNDRIGPLKLKRKGNDSGPSRVSFDTDCEPQPKVHLNEEFVTQTMSELYISHPRPKVARRNVNCDVAEATNMTELQELEEKFTHAAITGADQNLDLPLPPQRSRKLPSRRAPTLRLSLHQDLKNFKTTATIVPDSILSRYRPAARTAGTTALVLWRPPGGIVPDVISSTLKCDKGGRVRPRCYSEVTSTPYSSHENLADADMVEASDERSSVGGLFLSSHQLNSANHSPVSAEAPELSHPSPHIEEEEATVSPLQRRNSAPEICEPLPFVDDLSMEL